MKKPLLIQTLIISGLFLNSCNVFSSGNQADTNSASNSVSTQDNNSSSNQSNSSEKTETTQSPEPIQSEVSSVAGLKRATDPEDFVQQRGVTPGKNRNDPFTLFPVPPQEKSESAPSTQPSEATQPDTPSQPNNPPQPTAPPQPKLARGVTVQGALKIGNEAVVILRAPNEKTSRYVRPGQFIANGQVLVKQINMEERPTPTVVLKEMGVDEEVIKTVEEEMAVGTTTVKNESTMKLPPPPPQINS